MNRHTKPKPFGSKLNIPTNNSFDLIMFPSHRFCQRERFCWYGKLFLWEAPRPLHQSLRYRWCTTAYPAWYQQVSTLQACLHRDGRYLTNMFNIFSFWKEHMTYEIWNTFPTPDPLGREACRMLLKVQPWASSQMALHLQPRPQPSPLLVWAQPSGSFLWSPWKGQSDHWWRGASPQNQLQDTTAIIV